MSNFMKLAGDLDFAIKHQKNVLLRGERGVGKTQLIQKMFNDAYGEGNWKYYSTPTMDPWVDLVGCPREKKDENGKSYLELLRPREWENDNVQAIFLDELNRAPAKIKNALMELILFRSINGKKFNNLKVIWGAINPDDGSYDTEELDPAQMDRFSYIIDIPHDVNREYFSGKYGDAIAIPGCDWWSALDNNKKKLVSPRRLDEALDIIMKGGNVDNVLSKETNPGKLVKELRNGNSKAVLTSLLKERDPLKLETFFDNENNYFGCKDFVIQQDNSLLEFLPEEKLCEIFSSNEKVRDYCLNNITKVDKYMGIVNEIVKANSNKEIIEVIKNHPEYAMLYIDERLKQAIPGEKALMKFIKDNGMVNLEYNANLDDEPSIYKKNQKPVDIKDAKKVWKYIEDHKQELILSDTTMNVICKGIPGYQNLFSNHEEIKNFILEQ